MPRALLILAACSGGGKPAVHEPAVDLAKHLPATLEADKPKTGDPRPAKVRVWADAAVRALPHWKEDITEQIDYANQLLTPMLGAKLQVDDIKEWTREGDVHVALDQLVKADDGHDVTWVIGYTAPLDVASKAMSELGDAHVLGHHVVVHAWADKQEGDLLAAGLPELKPAQKTEVLAAHKRHKQTVVLLHHLAATLGAIAEADPAWIQHPLYGAKQSTFADRNRELMQLAIDARLSGGDDKVIAHDLLEAILKQDWGGWVPSDHDQVVNALKLVVDAAKSGRTVEDIPAAAGEQWDHIRQLHKQGNAKEALIQLDNLLVAYPGNATMLLEKCEIMLDKPGVADKTTRSTCAHVAEAAPGDPSVHFAIGEALAKAGDANGARAELEQAAQKIGNLKTAQADAWRRLIGIYQEMGALTWTEDAIAASHLEHDPVAPLIKQQRARYGLPKGARVKPEDEAAYVSALQNANAAIYADKFTDAVLALNKIEKKWPGTAGPWAARCDLALRRAAIDEARTNCSKAIALDPDDSWALYLSGVIALKDTGAASTAKGIELLKKAIAVDDELGQAWRALGKAYDRAKDTAAKDQLAKDYQTKFGKAL